MSREDDETKPLLGGNRREENLIESVEEEDISDNPDNSDNSDNNQDNPDNIAGQEDSANPENRSPNYRDPVVDPILLKVFSPDSLPKVKVFLGYLLVIFAGLTFTSANVVQKIVVPDISYWNLMCFRGAVQIVVMGIFIQLTDKQFVGDQSRRKRIVIQGHVGGLLLLAIFVAVKYVHLGNASAIFFCTPIFTFIFAVFMLGERMRLYRILICVLMFVGVIAITRPPFCFTPDTLPKDCHNGTNSSLIYSDACQVGNEINAVGYMCAFAVPALSAIVSILTRQLRRLRPSILMFWFGIGTFNASMIGLVYSDQIYFLFRMSGRHWLFTFVIIFLGLVGNISYTFAVRWVSPSKANVFRSFEVILNFLLQLTLEHMNFHASCIYGIGFLLIAVGLTGYERDLLRWMRATFGRRISRCM